MHTRSRTQALGNHLTLGLGCQHACRCTVYVRSTVYDVCNITRKRGSPTRIRCSKRLSPL
ncbi:hypothetical protein K504DRAFT_172212 [Pleomassaria siparia CBS 279.74]|uniref:Uncharacterized protein n=1 Tax=Pleomassaria siparia CBS 279.74 TaxID=1314801 RepID=A0A6G1JTK5_9PLEO|nr:hypothetical protein K504DRAFT_172212 [Pleomassaria siparia CBS 279.74]